MGGIFQGGSGGGLPFVNNPQSNAAVMSNAAGTELFAVAQSPVEGIFFNTSVTNSFIVKFVDQSPNTINIAEIAATASSLSFEMHGEDNSGGSSEFNVTPSGAGVNAEFRYSDGGVITTLDIDLNSSQDGAVIELASQNSGADMFFRNSASGSFLFDGTSSGANNSQVNITANLGAGSVSVHGESASVNQTVSIEANGASGMAIRANDTVSTGSAMRFIMSQSGIFRFSTTNSSETRVVLLGGDTESGIIAKNSGSGAALFGEFYVSVSGAASVSAYELRMFDGGGFLDIINSTTPVDFTFDQSSGGEFIFSATGNTGGALDTTVRTQFVSGGNTASGLFVDQVNGSGAGTFGRVHLSADFSGDTTNVLLSAYDGDGELLMTGDAAGNFAFNNATGGDFVVTGAAANQGLFHFLTAIAANGTVANVLGALGPAGSNVNVQEWLQIKNAAGTVRYIPCW